METGFALCIDAVSGDGETTGVSDNTKYGAGNPPRDALANYLLAQKLDMDGKPEPLGPGGAPWLGVGNPQPLSSLAWALPTPKDGWYRLWLLSAGVWDAGRQYQLGNGNGDVAHHLSALWLCAVDNRGSEPSTGNPDWKLAGGPQEALAYLAKPAYFQDTVILHRLGAAYKRGLYEEVGDGCCHDGLGVPGSPAMDAWLWLNGARSLAHDGRHAKAEEVVRHANKHADAC